MSRPMLLPYLRPLWRDSTTLQLGTDPARAVVLEFADRAAAQLLDLLDGMRSEAGIVTAAVARGVPPALARDVISTLRAAGVGVGAHTLFPRGHTFVVRVGSERRPAALVARAYAQRGVAHITVTVRDGAVVVGPLVPPAGSPCLRCVDLHRVDRDPAWPALAAQLATADPAPLT